MIGYEPEHTTHTITKPQEEEDTVAATPADTDGSCSIFVANLPKSWSNTQLHQELWKAFGPLGLLHCRATRDAKGLPIAFMRFSQPVLLEQLPNTNIGGRQIRLEYGRYTEEPDSTSHMMMSMPYFPVPVTVLVNHRYYMGSLQTLLMRFGRVLEISLEGAVTEDVCAYGVLFASPQEAFWCFDALNRYPVEGVTVKISFQ